MSDAGFKLNANPKISGAINRTLRLDADLYERIEELAQKYNLSFNKVANNSIRYALDNLVEDEEDNEK